MISSRKASPRSLLARIATLRQRHRALDARILDEERRPMPDMARLKRLKQEKLGLKDAIAVTRTTLARLAPETARTG